jgi:hypothetical protein
VTKTHLVVAPEPAVWLEPLLRRLPLESTCLVAPWAPASIHGVATLRIPGFSSLHSGLMRVLSRAGSAQLKTKILWRQALDLLVAQFLPVEARWIWAPSLGARATFARFPQAHKVLLADLPPLKNLHDDLDFAARSLPHCAYLRHFRADAPALVQQTEEYGLATAIEANSRAAAKVIERVSAAPVTPLFQRTPLQTLVFLSDGPVLLAGSTASRGGLEVALAAAEKSGQTLMARRQGGTAPASLKHPRLQLLDADSSASLHISALWVPTWMETTAPEIAQALRAHIPVWATDRALGWQLPGPGLQVVPRGDSQSLLRPHETFMG